MKSRNLCIQAQNACFQLHNYYLCCLVFLVFFSDTMRLCHICPALLFRLWSIHNQKCERSCPVIHAWYVQVKNLVVSKSDFHAFLSGLLSNHVQILTNSCPGSNACMPQLPCIYGQTFNLSVSVIDLLPSRIVCSHNKVLCVSCISVQNNVRS